MIDKNIICRYNEREAAPAVRMAGVQIGRRYSDEKSILCAASGLLSVRGRNAVLSAVRS